MGNSGENIRPFNRGGFAYFASSGRYFGYNPSDAACSAQKNRERFSKVDCGAVFKRKGNIADKETSHRQKEYTDQERKEIKPWLR